MGSCGCSQESHLKGALSLSGLARRMSFNFSRLPTCTNQKRALKQTECILLPSSDTTCCEIDMHCSFCLYHRTRDLHAALHPPQSLGLLGDPPQCRSSKGKPPSPFFYSQVWPKQSLLEEIERLCLKTAPAGKMKHPFKTIVNEIF